MINNATHQFLIISPSFTKKTLKICQQPPEKYLKLLSIYFLLFRGFVIASSLYFPNKKTIHTTHAHRNNWWLCFVLPSHIYIAKRNPKMRRACFNFIVYSTRFDILSRTSFRWIITDVLSSTNATRRNFPITDNSKSSDMHCTVLPNDKSYIVDGPKEMKSDRSEALMKLRIIEHNQCTRRQARYTLRSYPAICSQAWPVKLAIRGILRGGIISYLERIPLTTLKSFRIIL